MKLFLSGLLVFCSLTLPCLAEQASTAQATAVAGPLSAHVDRSQPPEVSSPPSMALPAVQKYKLSNGIEVWFSANNKVPMTTVALGLRAGALQEKPGKFGVTSLMTSAMDEGCGKYDALTFASAVDALGAALSASSSMELCGAALTVPTVNLEKGLALMGDMVLRPTFPQKELDRLKAEALVGFQQIRKDPASLASAALWQKMFAGHRRLHVDEDGQAQDWVGFTRDDVVAVHKEVFNPQKAFFVVTGSADPEQVLPLLEKEFGKWKAAASSSKFAGVGRRLPSLGKDAGTGSVSSVDRMPFGRRDLPFLNKRERGSGVDGYSAQNRTLYFVDRPDSAQTVIAIGCEGPGARCQEFYDLKVLNVIFGGCFTSRLNQNLREKNKFTYGAHSSVSMQDTYGTIMISTNVESQHTVAALNEILKEMQNIVPAQPEQDLSNARNLLGYSFPAGFETSAGLAGRLVDLRRFNYDEDFYNKYVGNIMAVDAQGVSRAAARYLNPRDFSFVCVGDASSQVPLLKAAGWNVQEMSVDDCMGPMVEVK